MAERQNILTCIFDPKSPGISAFEIHEWIHDQLRIPEHEVQMLQIDGPKRQVFINLKQCKELHRVIQEINGLQKYKHSNGEILQVRIEMAGLGTKCIRIANLPPEVPEGPIRTALAQYGDIKTIQEELWSKAYRYAVSNGIKIITMALKKPIPSHATIASHRMLISYEGQPITCYGCNATDYVYQICPKRLETGKGRRNEQINTWAHVARHGTQKTDNGEKKINAPTNNNEPKNGEHINEEGTGVDTDPECSTQADPSLPIVQEQNTLNTDTDNRCKMEELGTTETEIQDSRNEEDEKGCDEQYTGPKTQQHENQKPTTTELANGNKTTERLNTNRVDKTNNDIIQNPQGGMGDMQDVRNNRQPPKKLKLEGNGEPSAE